MTKNSSSLESSLASGFDKTVPKEFEELQKFWSKIKRILKNTDDIEEYSKDLIEYYQNRINASCFAFEPIISETPPSEIDRLGDVLRGPLYTCENYEWPLQSGYPMVPLIQLDLARCSSLGEINLGDGLLQVFMGHEKFMGLDARIRVVPRREVAIERLLPVPFFDQKIKAFANIDWATQATDPRESVIPALQINGYSDPVFSVHHMAPLDERTDIEDLVSIGVPLDVIDGFSVAITQCMEKYKTSGFHLFGTFSPIQYEASERPMPLFCLESENGFNFGDGNGQVFFEKLKKSGSRIFSFDWSCF